MPRTKKTTTTVEEQLQDIEDKKATDFLDEKVEDGRVVEEIPKEETKGETPKEEVAVEEPKFDPVKLKEEITAEVTKETTDKIIQSLTGKESTQDQRDHYQVIADDFLKEHGRNPSWHELIPFIKDDLKADLKAEQEAQLKEIEEKKKVDEAVASKNDQAFNTYIDQQLEELYVQGKLPRITTPVTNINDKNDPGLKDPGFQARQALFQAMLDENQKRSAEGKPAVYSIKEIYYEHYKAPTEQPAGADAPVSMGRGATVHNEDDSDYSYAEIHKPKSMMEVIAGAFKGR